MSKDNKTLINEANSLMKKGESSKKGGFFHKPDFHEAFGYFKKAADNYSQCGLHEQAMDAYEKAADCSDQENMSSNTADCFIQAAKSALACNKNGDILRLLLEAKVRYAEVKKPLQSIRAFKDFAIKTKSLELYEEALTVIEESEQYHWEKDLFLDYALLVSNNKDFPKAYEAWDRAYKAFSKIQNYDTAAHCISAKIAYMLAEGDMVAADRALNDAMQDGEFIKTDDYSMVDFLVRGVKNHDGTLIKKAQDNVIIQFLRADVQKVVFSFSAPIPEEDLVLDTGDNHQVTAPEPEETPEDDESKEKQGDDDWLC